MTSALSCKDLSVSHEHEDPPTLQGIDFSLEPGERAALVGLNGSGKTSLLMSLVGLVHFHGEIRIAGEALTKKSLGALRKKVGFLFNVPEDQLLFSKVLEDVAFGLIQAGRGKEEALARAREVLEDLGIGHLWDQPVHHLSHGQKQRVALAGAVATRPPLLLLDEPTAGMDPPSRRELADLLNDLDSAQLIATHDLDFADRVCAKIIHLEGGTIARITDDTRDIRGRWAPSASVVDDEEGMDR